MSTLVKVARAEDVPDGTVRYAEANGVRLAICNVAGKFYAIQDVCTHDGGSLDQGELDGIAIECPRHGGRFDVTTGRVLALPPVRPVRTYPVEIEDGEIAVEVD
jgi:3-phenylpropionate/trans-cinnamate dioxygenase ferredoxin subunit